MGEPASTARRLAALACWPGWGRRASRSAAKARSVASRASTLQAAATSATVRRCLASWAARQSIPRIPSVPLVRAKPSFSTNCRGSMPARARASAAPIAPSSVNTSPSPIRTSAAWASGARSPLAPREPCSGTTGTTPALIRRTSDSATCGLAPDAPKARVRALRNIMALTTSASTAGPIPAAWDRIRDCWSAARRSAGMVVLARAPKPVEIP